MISMHYTSWLLGIFMYGALVTSTQAVPNDDPSDRAALIDFYNSTVPVNSNWYVSTNWTAPNISFCYWYGITCSCSSQSPFVCHVRSVLINVNHLVGTLPESIGNFKAITNFSVTFNQLRSTIPASICKLVTLTHLRLSSNLLIGPIPSCIGQLSNLVVLDLGDNQLSDSLPESLFNLKSLSFLFLSQNLLSGTLSERVGNLSTKLENLYLDGNFFSGSLPQSLGNLTQLTSIFFGMNNFSSSIPDSIGNLVNMKILSAQDCKLSGTLPSTMVKMRSLVSLTLYGNRLTGTIPASLGQITTITSIVLYNNLFYGSIPPSITLLPAINALWLSNNLLNGTLDMSLSFAPSSTKLTALRLSSNQFTGTLPLQLTSYSKLKILEIGNCRLNGTIPDFIGLNMKKLNSLILNGNRFTSTIPASLGLISPLKRLDLSSNMFVGQLPAKLVNLTLISYFDVSCNQLSGPLNLDFSFLPASNIQYFSVSYNSLSGSLDTLLKYPFMPGILNLSNNRFSSAFPTLPFVYIPFPSPDPIFGTVAPASLFLSFGYTTIRFVDARGSDNIFDCPIPDYVQSETLFLRSSCRPQFDALQSIFLNYVIGIASVVVFYVLLRFGLSRYDSSSSAARQVTQFTAILQYLFLWGVYIFTLYCDQGIFVSMLRYLATTVDNCKPVNFYYSFISYMPYQPMDALSTFTPTAFADWTQGIIETAKVSSFLDQNSNIPPEILSNIEAFRSLCVDMVDSGCGIRQAINADHPEYLTPAYFYASECYLQYPEQAPFGGSGHPTFQAIVITILAVRCTIELARALLVLVALCLRRIPFAELSVDFIGTSVFAPLLVFALGTDAFRSEVLTYRPTPYDLIRRFVVSSLMCSLSLLAVNCYFFLVVNQKGLDAPSVGSAVMGTLSALSLMVRVCLSFRSELAESKLLDQRRGDQIHVDLTDLPSDVGEFAGVLRVGAMVADALHDRSSSASIVDLNEIELAPSLPARDQSACGRVESSAVGSQSADQSTERMDAEFLGASVSKSDA